MRLFLDICTGLGLSASAGIRPFLPALVSGVLAGFNVGVDYEGTDFAFLEKAWFLGLMLALMAVALVAMRRLGAAAVESGPLGAALSGIAIAVGGLLFAGVLADHGYAWWPGLLAGIAVAAFAQLAVRSLFTRVRARLDRHAQDSLVVFADGTSAVGSALAILVPPVSIVLVGFLAWLLAGGRRRAGEKYAGLRILR
ncbi:DUF4126 domain-containing protein [Capillimicrobium parvum]|uniref:DUF4126 domain-containing protein n=1 Tax=Capillimicrobium parvum TaxID=2884022 RepID=A0A9E7C7G8_9ACTN|nr:DUF4126 domain-containing protein [Capillimicrobium parvum]UGS39313.1 hypothetical protein DSM104329_05748 [Capillimicrobium parvum]